MNDAQLKKNVKSAYGGYKKIQECVFLVEP